jgi:two-component system, chemotaxis family, chemotaxis protein CheY
VSTGGTGLTMLRNVLVVDDSMLIQQMYESFLSCYPGVRVLRALDGAEAMAALSREPDVDLVLLDINMPVMNGLQFLEQMKAEPAYRPIPVIVITTEGRDEDFGRCLAVGASRCLRKPFRKLELYGLVEELTGARPA